MKQYIFHWILLASMLMVVESSDARSWRHWWVHPDRDGYRLLQEGDPLAAAKTFENSGWRGAAFYRGGNYEEALHAFSQGMKSDLENEYNCGNTLAHLGRFQEAIDAYNKVLKQNPNHLDAMHNKIVVEKLLQQSKESKKSTDGSNDKSLAKQDKSKMDQSGRERDGKDSAPSASQRAAGKKEAGSGKQQSAETQKQDQGDDRGQKFDKDSKVRQAVGSSEVDQNQPLDQWLQQVPDDPGGLLKQKFKRDYEKRHQRG